LNDENTAGPLLTLLRLLLSVGLGLALAGGVSIAAILLPKAVDDTTARIWISIGLFGLALAGLAALGIYALRAIGAERMSRWLRSSSSEEVSDSTARAAAVEAPNPEVSRFSS
jgi:hypothetical protein